MTGGDLLLPEVQHSQNMASIRFKDGTRIFHSVYIVDKTYLVTTARFATQIFRCVDEDGSAKTVVDGKIRVFDRFS